MNLYALCRRIENCDYPPLPGNFQKQTQLQTYYLGNLYSEDLRDTITACIQTDRMARPDITQIRLKCEQMLQVFEVRVDNSLLRLYTVKCWFKAPRFYQCFFRKRGFKILLQVSVLPTLFDICTD